MQWDLSVLKSNKYKRYRYKEWEFYAIYTKDVTITFGIATFNYISSVFFTVYENGKKPEYHQKIILPNVELDLSPNPRSGRTFYESETVLVDFQNLDVKFKQLKFRFEDKISLSLDLFKKTDESMVSLNPLSSDGSKFFYTYKDYNNFVSGNVTAFGRTHSFASKVGAIDFGRGVWPYHSFWIWGSAQGRLNQHSFIGLNIGEFMFSNESKATEDAV